MPPLNHRAPGLAGALLANAAATVGLIADGIHLHPAMVKLIWTIKGGPSLTLVSDAMAALGMAAGRYQLADQTVTVTENEARLPDGTLAGAVLSLEAGLRNLIDFAQCSLAEALPAVTTTPANLLKLAHRRGQLSPGYPADLVLLTPALQVALTLVGGEILYRNEQILPNGS
jgi:N-acetylglucosamine-6-phosphate deacetylase